jgi:hypothetical protein
VTTKKPPVAASEPAPVASGSSASSDVALIHGVTPDGQGLHILRARENRVELGFVRPLREGAPITGEVVTLKPRPNSALCDVEVQYKPPAVTSDRAEPAKLLAHPGPAQVATDEYRRNWDAIWSHAPEKPKLAN